MVRGSMIAFAMMAIALGAVPAAARDCVMLVEAVQAGAFIGDRQVSHCPCRENAPSSPIGFDRRVGAPYAAEDLPAGTYLGPLTLRPGHVLAAGSELRVAYRSGSVIVERDVRLLVPARGGEQAFARAQDGTVFTAPLMASTPPESGL